MAWPRKGTRKLVVDGVSYLWHTTGHCPICSAAHCYTIGQPSQPFVLYIDPLPHDFALTPKSVATAIQWAVHRGWSTEDGPTRAMAFDAEQQDFVWLPDGARHLSDVRS